MREALPPVSALERINDLTTRIADGVLRWHRGSMTRCRLGMTANKYGSSDPGEDECG
jgi:hypothetical protein